MLLILSLDFGFISVRLFLLLGDGLPELDAFTLECPSLGGRSGLSFTLELLFPPSDVSSLFYAP